VVVEDADEFPPLLAELVEHVNLVGLGRQVVEIDLAVFPHLHSSAPVPRALNPIWLIAAASASSSLAYRPIGSAWPSRNRHHRACFSIV